MKKFLLGLTVMALIFMAGGIAYAGTTATQTFNVAINEINELSVSGNPSGLTVSTATAGYDPYEVSDENVTYSITTNGTGKKITGQITSGGSMPTNMNLSVALSAPPFGNGGEGEGSVVINAATASNLIINISSGKASGKSIFWLFYASASAGTMTSTSKTITLTLCAQ